jgi:transposase
MNGSRNPSFDHLVDARQDRWREGNSERLGGRRRRWSEDEKLKIVLESLQAPRQVAATARRYGLSRSLLFRWRQAFHPEPKTATGQQMGFIPARVVPNPCVTAHPVGPASSGAIEIEFAAGARMRITGTVDAATLKAAVSVGASVGLFESIILAQERNPRCS